MNVLAIDTATERCSVALRVDGRWFERTLDTQRGHAEFLLGMVDEVLTEAGVRLHDLAGIAYGRGPGAFTGVRIAIGVVQGLAFGAQLPTAGVSNLAAVAQQVVDRGARILVCMDARMNEVYWARFERDSTGLVTVVGAERLSSPEAVDDLAVDVVVGSAMVAYPALATTLGAVPQIAALPRAREILMLGEGELREGRGGSAFDAQPVYLRDQVTFVKPR